MIVLNICKTIENVNNIADNSLQKALVPLLNHTFNAKSNRTLNIKYIVSSIVT